MFYHCSRKEDNAFPICGVLLEGDDVVVPYEEVMFDNGRHFNHPDCAETLATLAGGSTRRNRPIEAD